MAPRSGLHRSALEDVEREKVVPDKIEASPMDAHNIGEVIDGGYISNRLTGTGAASVVPFKYDWFSISALKEGQRTGIVS